MLVIQLFSTEDQFNLVNQDSFLFLKSILNLEDLEGYKDNRKFFTVLSGSKLKLCLVPERVLMKICIADEFG